MKFHLLDSSGDFHCSEIVAVQPKGLWRTVWVLETSLALYLLSSVCPSSQSSGGVTQVRGQSLLTCQEKLQCVSEVGGRGAHCDAAVGRTFGRTLGWKSPFGSVGSLWVHHGPAQNPSSPRPRARAFCKTKMRFGLVKVHISLSSDGEHGKVGSGQAEAFAQLKPLRVSFHLHRALGQYMGIFLHC